MIVERTLDASVEPITLAEAKAHLRVSHDDENSLIESLIKSARMYSEGFLRRAILLQKWVIKLDSFPADDGPIVLPYPPLQQVETFQYVDTAGDSQTLTITDDYLVDTVAVPGVVYLPYGVYWPTPRDQRNAVSIVYQAGYSDADSVPAPIKQAILLMVGHWYEHREEVVVGTITSTLPMAAEALLWQYRDYRMA